MIKEFFRPTWMRIIFFPLLLLVLPAGFRVCNETCGWSMQWLAGVKLLTVQEVGELTFPAMVLWFAIAYFFACLIAVNYEYFTEI